jgi:homoserine dehydrogenase
MAKIGLIGCGTVGSGVAKLLRQNQEEITQKTGTPVIITKVLDRHPDICRQCGFTDEQIATDYQQILEDPEIDIVVELIGGIEPARSFILAAMQNGKNVVSANKDLIAVHGEELFATAEAHGVDFYFEASVGGGIPIITPLKQTLAGNKIQEVIGILNGTTNYILTKMSREGLDFAEVLKEAQELGYAESDPTADVDGLDAARKIAILASIAFNSRVTFDDVYHEGIGSITPVDIKTAADMGYVIKLLAIAKEENGKIQARVHPAFLPVAHPLAMVNDVFNAVFLRGDAVGDVMHYGRGAGQMPTASSVVGDIIEIVRNQNASANGRLGCTCYYNKAIQDIADIANQFYIHLIVTDQPGVLGAIASAFGEHEVSLASVMQQTDRGDIAELVVITHQVKEQCLRDALQVLQGMDIVKTVNNVIRLEGTD